ncbi:MAG: PIN domain-containing protein [Spirochaetaceae bacterium]|jgi:predicted nucleic acid-binding protein|nr:PIN domain-containing protein [Spirochaetaceae bacterium]
MNDKAFIDTNVLIYLYSVDEFEKRNISQTAVDTYDCIISTQVLNEFCNVCIKKLNKTTDEIKLAVEEIIGQCAVTKIEREHISQALETHKKYGYGYFDCLMIVSALNSGCKYLLTEDMNDGQLIDEKLTIVNIYAQAYPACTKKGGGL